MQSNLLKGWLKANGLTYKQCAKSLNISSTSFNNKVNNAVEFKLSEVVKLVALATQPISNEELVKIFFN